MGHKFTNYKSPYWAFHHLVDVTPFCFTVPRLFVFFVLLLHSHVSLPIIFVVTIHSRQDLLPKIAFFKGTLCFCLPPIWICFRFEKRSIICKMFRPFLNCSFLFFNFCFFSFNFKPSRELFLLFRFPLWLHLISF